MKIILSITTFLIFLTSCIDLTTPEKPVCLCCENIYTNVDDALNCIDKKPDTTRAADGPFLLLAFLPGDLKANQKLGWNILKDQDIIKTAKKDYLLVILDTAEIRVLNKEYSTKIPDYNKNQPVFIMANTALYGFGSWTFTDKKESIINWLEIADGP